MAEMWEQKLKAKTMQLNFKQTKKKPEKNQTGIQTNCSDTYGT